VTIVAGWVAKTMCAVNAILANAATTVIFTIPSTIIAADLICSIFGVLIQVVAQMPKDVLDKSLAKVRLRNAPEPTPYGEVMLQSTAALEGCAKQITAVLRHATIAMIWVVWTALAVSAIQVSAVTVVNTTAPQTRSLAEMYIFSINAMVLDAERHLKDAQEESTAKEQRICALERQFIGPIG